MNRSSLFRNRPVEAEPAPAAEEQSAPVEEQPVEDTVTPAEEEEQPAPVEPRQGFREFLFLLFPLRVLRQQVRALPLPRKRALPPRAQAPQP